MKTRRLGQSGIVVSEICMGTMTFGSQCDEKTSFAIMDKAYDSGVDFFDTAEIYPVPPNEETFGITEKIVGKWLKGKKRDSVIIATKVAGPGHGWFKPPVRTGRTCLDRHQIIRAAEGSLTRLGIETIDLYQTHWPDHDMRQEETLAALTELVDTGKVRAIGCSNENPWGLMKNIAVSAAQDLARFDTIQNNFSLNNRRFEDALADICRREKISLLPYSPLAGGVLTGKYNEGVPANSRFASYFAHGQERQRKMADRFVNDKAIASTERFIKIAKEAGMSATTLAVAWSKQHDFVASTIIGATSVEQLSDSLKAADLLLEEDILRMINEVSREFMYPMG